MFTALENKTIEHIETVRKLINIHQNSLETETAKNRERIKIYSSASSLTRLYAILEGFISTAMSDYLDYLSGEKKYSELSSKFHQNYRIGFSRVLSRTHHESSRNLNHLDLVNWYHSAINDSESYRFINKAFTLSDNNFRLSVIETIFNNADLPNLRQWLNNSDEIQKLYPESNTRLSKLDNDINELVKLRNDASHSSIIEITGQSILLKYCQLIESLIISISSFLRKEVLNLKINSKKNKIIGKVTEIFQKHNAIILKTQNIINFKIGDKVFIQNKKACYEDEIKSIMLNGFNTTSIKTKQNNLEIGLTFKKTPYKNSLIII